MIPSHIAGLLCTILFFSCARQIPPTGGERDEQPPVLILSQPENKSTNFAGQEILLEFDEYVKEDNLLKQLIITPRIEHGYKSRLVKKQLRLLFEQPFNDSTTYTLNFREGIKDITESNPADNLNFVFSTGDFLDSLSIEGKVNNLLTGKPANDVTVTLYLANDTLDIFNSQPIYLAKTAEDGSYRIDNIKNGSYKIFASLDENQNLKTESQSESYGFKNVPINLQDSIVDLNIVIQHLDIRPIRILSARPVGSNFEIKFNKYITDYQLHYPESEIDLVGNLVDKNRTLRIYKSPMLSDSIKTTIQVTDSTETNLLDTLYVKFEESKRASEKPTLNVKPANNEEIDPEFMGKLTFNKPVRHVINDSLFFEYDSTLITYVDPQKDIIWNENRTEANLTMVLDPTALAKSLEPIDQNDTLAGPPEQPKSKKKSNLRFYSGSGSFISIENDTFPSIERKYTFKKPENYGVIAGNILSEKKSFVIQLIDKNQKIIDTIISKHDAPLSNYRFISLKPGEYGFRILIDENHNGKWDPGNYFEQLEPEKIVFYTNPDDGGPTINLIQNWELTEIDLSF